MCGIPLLLLKRVNKPTTKDNWLVYRHRSDREEGERGRLDVSQIVWAAGSFKGHVPDFWDVQRRCGHCFGWYESGASGHWFAVAVG